MSVKEEVKLQQKLLNELKNSLADYSDKASKNKASKKDISHIAERLGAFLPKADSKQKAEVLSHFQNLKTTGNANQLNGMQEALNHRNLLRE